MVDSLLNFDLEGKRTKVRQEVNILGCSFGKKSRTKSTIPAKTLKSMKNICKSITLLRVQLNV